MHSIELSENKKYCFVVYRPPKDNKAPLPFHVGINIIPRQTNRIGGTIFFKGLFYAIDGNWNKWKNSIIINETHHYFDNEFKNY